MQIRPVQDGGSGLRDEPCVVLRKNGRHSQCLIFQCTFGISWSSNCCVQIPKRNNIRARIHSGPSRWAPGRGNERQEGGGGSAAAAGVAAAGNRGRRRGPAGGCGRGRRLLRGTSGKGTSGRVLGLPVAERLEGTAATVALAIDKGADMVRVHDVRAMTRVARMSDAIVRGWAAGHSLHP